MTFDEILDDIADQAAEIIDDNVDDILERASENPRELETLDAELLLLLITLWESSIDELAQAANDETNELLEQSESLEISDDQAQVYKLIGGYFFLEAMRRAFAQIHSAAIATQIPDDERETQIEQATDNAKEAVNNSVLTELAVAYGVFIQIEQEARGISSYRWQTRGDNRVRPSHRANEGRVFSWDRPPAATGHPGNDHGCRCSAIPILNSESKSMIKSNITLSNGREQRVISAEGFSVKAMSANKVGIEISGTIGDPWDSNTTQYEIANWAGITDSTTEIELMISSYGGDMFEGIAIYNYLRNHPARVTTRVNGICASAATFILLAGDVRIVERGSIVGVHYPYPDACMCGLNHEQAQALSDQLKPYSDAMVEIYTDRLRIPESEIRTMLSKEESLTSERALQVGFATAVVPETTAVTDDIIQSRLVQIKALTENEKTTFINRVTDGGNPMSNTTTAGDIGGQSVNEIQAKYDVLAHKNSELSAQNETLKSELDALKSAQAEMRESVKAEVLAEQKALADVLAKADEIGVKAQGETASELMRFVIAAKGVQRPDAFEGDALQAIFEHVVSEYGSKEADAVYSKTNNTATAKRDPWAAVNQAV